MCTYEIYLNTQMREQHCCFDLVCIYFVVRLFQTRSKIFIQRQNWKLRIKEKYGDGKKKFIQEIMFQA
jgi:hypothetical protein